MARAIVRTITIKDYDHNLGLSGAGWSGRTSWRKLNLKRLLGVIQAKAVYEGRGRAADGMYRQKKQHMKKTKEKNVTRNCGSVGDCMQVRKQQLELDMEQQTGSKEEKEYVKAVYCHPAYLTYMQSTS